MKLKFKQQRFQTDAARCVTRAFAGQGYCDTYDYLMDMGREQGAQQALFGRTGFGNAKINIDRTAITENIRKVQMEQGLKPIEQLEGADSLTLTVEMETGTGKTYTYIKTMYELNKLYGWSKFIVVVPSIAIREGVMKSFETMQEHFADMYGKRMQYFVYNSKQLTKIDNFASDAGMHVMIINTQAFNNSFDKDKKNKDTNKIFSECEDFGYRKPIDVIAKTNPIMIIDEPQSVLGANKKNSTRKNLKHFNPLFSLLYSATHRQDDIYNMVYRLDAMDAYNKKLVKKIEVKGITQVGTTATNGYLYLEEIVISKGNPQARLGFDIKTASTTKQTTRLVGEGYNLYDNSGELAEYENGFIVERIDGIERKVCFVNGIELYEGDAIGQVNEDLMRRIQIRETIRTHLERERKLYGKGIKVLSLFFIDHVENYRRYESGSTSNGKWADIFEEEYKNVVDELAPTFAETAYAKYLSRFEAKDVHDGYFSQDKKGHFIDSKEKKQYGGSDDESAYDLIMRNKERLLSFDEPVRFIFSHSALKEGWDNPNVFQICTLKNSDNETKKRQEVGRGMRLCVNKDGERQDAEVLGDAVFDTNILTIIASESYDQFAKKLQTEIADACGDRPVVVTPTLFADRVFVMEDGSEQKISVGKAVEINNVLVFHQYLDMKGQLTQKYFDDKKNGRLDFGELNNMKNDIVRVLDSVFDPSSIGLDNARTPREAHFDEKKFKNEFIDFWNRINVRTVYTVDFKSEDLIKKAIKDIDDMLSVTVIRMVVESGSLENIRDKESLENGTAMTDAKVHRIDMKESVGGSVRYDLVGRIVEATGLTRRTIVTILKGINSQKFAMYKQNPEEFIIKTSKIINDCKASAVIEQIRYEKTSQKFDTDIFTEATIRGKLGVNAIESSKSLYDLVVVDSQGIEKHFAEELEKESDVKVYTKLPRGFYINTPMGHYNPDWAIVFNEGAMKHIYFVAETKGNDEIKSELRGVEESKIECARRHFNAISKAGDVKYDVVKTYQKLYDLVAK